MEPLISVIIITYNQEAYIQQAVESVLRQKVEYPIEILIGEDASTDQTGDILNEWKHEEHLRLFHRDKNRGASANLYDLLKCASGKYIAMLEGDDFWTDENKLQRQMDFLQNHPEYIGCTHECLLVDEKGEPLPVQGLEWISKSREFGIKESKGFYLAGQMGTLMCRNIFKDSGTRYDIIYKAHPMISDRTVQMVLALEGKLYRLKECMSAYRQISSVDKNNATSQYFVKNIHSAYDNFMLTCYLEDFCKQYTESEKISFSYTKKLFFTSAVYQGFWRKSPAVCQDVKKILNSPGVKKWSYLLFLPRGILHKLFQKQKKRY